MAHDTLTYAPAKPRLEAWLIDAAFLGLLLLAFVGVQPFAERNPATDLQMGPYTATGGGDWVRQAFYAAVFLSIGAVAFFRKGLGLVKAVPPMILVTLLWCAVTALWATAPDVAVRRAGLAFVVAISTFLCVDTIGAERSFRIWWFVLAGVLIVNWLSIPLVHQSVHLPGEQDVGLVGDWRGLYFHKNIAGAVCAVSALVFGFSAVKSKSWIDIVFCLAAIGFTVMTKSKTSLGLLFVAFAIGFTYRFAWRRDLDRMIVGIAALLFVFLFAAFIAVDADAISRMLEDPNEFTGRSAIWAAELAFIADHPLLGSGFGTFADSGTLSPLHNYVAGSWVEQVAHGHSGYLQLLVTIGGIGFVLTILACVAVPLWQFWQKRGGDLNRTAMLFAIFVFIVLHNFLESDFLEGDSPAWMSFLLMLAFLRAPQTERVS
ncbi:MAG TPA: O-antigen ligase [Rhizomicrobium sp.]|nr:O-antigen ligase [Rhizomicrobium sp.]